MIRETGRVWSGALITPRGGQMLVGITGRWKVPRVTLPASAGTTAEGKRVRSSSTWIGLDGARSYLNSSLPQIGTGQNVIVKNGKMEPEYFAWHEWWCAGHFSHPIRLDLPIKPDDWIRCTLTVDTLTRVIFHMKNETTGLEVASFPVDAPNKPPVAGSSAPPIQRLISGATAEWITERPSDPDTDKPYELANYGTVVFENCLANAASDPDSARENQTLDGATLRDMVQISQNRPELISRAELQGPQSVATFYRGS